MDLLPPRKMIISKSGNRPNECEDDCRASYPVRLGHDDESSARFALADGATESAFAREWAQILVRDFVERPPDLANNDTGCLEEWLRECRQSWDRLIPWSRIPWHGEAKTRAGALATLLGLSIRRKPGASSGLVWRALAVGDSCLFLIRQDQLLLSFPLDNSAQFDNTPALLCSNAANNGRLGDMVERAEGNCQPGDLILLASDALAGWFLTQHAAGEKPWHTLRKLEPAQWECWVNTQREAGAIRNDDTTLVVTAIR